MRVYHGGPEPLGEQFAYPNRHTLGVSLRDYFAAHAPEEPQPWFSPVMSSARPMPTYDHDHPNGPYCRMTKCDCGGITNLAEMRAWDMARDRERLVQWPYAWADAMLEARAT